MVVLTGEFMITEHAITYKERLGIAELEYLVLKAARLGRNGHHVLRVYQEEDSEGFHVYFEVNRREVFD